MKVTLSKSQWESIGISNGWMRIARHPSENDIQDKQFLNYLKTQNETFIFFHGTSSKKWEEIQKSGFMISPKQRGNEEEEQRTKGLDQIYYTPLLEYAANEYSARESKKDNGQPVILILEIPLYLIAEIQAAINGQDIYNEGQAFNKVKDIISKQISNEEKAEELKQYIRNSDDNEFTTVSILPIRFVKHVEYLNPTNTTYDIYYANSVEKLTQSLVNGKIDIKIFERMITTDYALYNALPENIKNNSEIQKARIEGLANYVSKKSKNYDELTEEEMNHPIIFRAYIDSWIKHLKTNLWDYDSYPQNIKNNNEVKKARIEEWAKAIMGDDWDMLNDHLPDDLVNNQYLNKTLFQKWINDIENDIDSLYIAPEGFEGFEDDPRVKQAYVNGWISILKNDPNEYESCPEELKYDQRILDILPEDMKQNHSSRLFSSCFNDNYIGKLT